MDDELRAVFSEVLGINPEQISPEMSPTTEPKWDSLATASLIAAIEKQFDLVLGFDELMEFTTYESMSNILSKRRAES